MGFVRVAGGMRDAGEEGAAAFYFFHEGGDGVPDSVVGLREGIERVDDDLIVERPGFVVGRDVGGIVGLEEMDFVIGFGRVRIEAHICAGHRFPSQGRTRQIVC